MFSINMLMFFIHLWANFSFYRCSNSHQPDNYVIGKSFR